MNGRDSANLSWKLEELRTYVETALPLLRMPPPEKVKIARPVEHHELHTDTSESEYDA